MRFQYVRLSLAIGIAAATIAGVAHLGHRVAMADRVVTVTVQFDRATGVVSFPDGGDVRMQDAGTIVFVATSVGSGAGNATITGVTFPNAPLDPTTEFAPRNGDSFGARDADGGLVLTDHCRREATFHYCLHVEYRGNSYSSDPEVKNEPTTGG